MLYASARSQPEQMLGALHSPCLQNVLCCCLVTSVSVRAGLISFFSFESHFGLLLEATEDVRNRCSPI